jgi:hypothetical protein
VTRDIAGDRFPLRQMFVSLQQLVKVMQIESDRILDNFIPGL